MNTAAPLSADRQKSMALWAHVASTPALENGDETNWLCATVVAAKLSTPAKLIFSTCLRVPPYSKPPTCSSARLNCQRVASLEVTHRGENSRQTAGQPSAPLFFFFTSYLSRQSVRQSQERDSVCDHSRKRDTWIRKQAHTFSHHQRLDTSEFAQQCTEAETICTLRAEGEMTRKQPVQCTVANDCQNRRTKWCDAVT